MPKTYFLAFCFHSVFMYIFARRVFILLSLPINSLLKTPNYVLDITSDSFISVTMFHFLYFFLGEKNPLLAMILIMAGFKALDPWKAL